MSIKKTITKEVDLVTDKDLQIMQMLSNSVTIPVIADEVCLSKKHVETRIQRMKKVLGIGTTLGLVKFLTKEGHIS